MRWVTTCTVVLVMGWAVAGCQTTMTVQEGGRTKVINVNEPPPFDETAEGKLVKAAQDDPDSPKGWWRLGDFYETMKDYPRAIQAYEKMLVASLKETKKSGVSYTAPYYLLGRCHALIRSWGPSVEYLKEVVKLQPKDIRKAYANVDFRESHYLLGAIYFEHKQLEDAKAHLETFQQLTPRNDHRADGMLADIYYELEPEKRSP